MKVRKPTRRKPTAGANKKRGGTLDGLVLERSDTVLWTIAPPGIVLHNFACRKFIQLDKVGYAAWGLLDGARTVKEVIERCTAGRSRQRIQVRSIVKTLSDNGFLVERSHV